MGSTFKRPLGKFEAILLLAIIGLPAAFLGTCSLATALGRAIPSGIDFRLLGWISAAIFIPLFLGILVAVIRVFTRGR